MAGSDTINLSWTAVSGALGYNIYRSTEPNGTYTKINSAPITATSYSDTGLTPNTIYYYQVECSRRIDVSCRIGNNRRNFGDCFSQIQ